MRSARTEIALLGLGLLFLASCGAGPGVLVLPTPTPNAAPEVVIQRYFAAQEQGDVALAWTLLGPDWRAQYPADQWRHMLAQPQPVHFRSAKETAASVAQRAERREYLVELEVSGTHRGAWHPGHATRFVGLLQGDHGWPVDAIATSAGFLSCGFRGCGSPPSGATPGRR